MRLTNRCTGLNELQLSQGGNIYIYISPRMDIRMNINSFGTKKCLKEMKLWRHGCLGTKENTGSCVLVCEGNTPCAVLSG